MTAREKIDAAVAFLRSRHISARTAAPAAWRLCWRCGLNVPPPHFLGFLSIAFLTGTMFGFTMALVLAIPMFLTGVPIDVSGVLVFVSANVLGAILFGLPLATYYRWSVRRLGLPTWSEFAPDLVDDDSVW